MKRSHFIWAEKEMLSISDLGYVHHASNLWIFHKMAFYISLFYTPNVFSSCLYCTITQQDQKFIVSRKHSIGMSCFLSHSFIPYTANFIIQVKIWDAGERLQDKMSHHLLALSQGWIIIKNMREWRLCNNHCNLKIAPWLKQQAASSANWSNNVWQNQSGDCCDTDLWLLWAHYVLSSNLFLSEYIIASVP